MKQHQSTNRSGSVYIAVLGTSLIVSVLAISALALQRIQNRMFTASAEIRQAQLNADTGIALGLLEMRQDPNWRATYTSGDLWFTLRGIGAGACSLEVIDPIDGDLADDPNDPVVMTSIGYNGGAVQRTEVTVDPREQPLECLRAAVAAGGTIALANTVLRTSNTATVSANTVAALSSTVYGAVEAVTVGGSTYAGTTSTIGADELPQMPDWSTVFDYYLANGTEIDVASLPATAPNLGRNVGIETGTTTYWTGTPPGVPTATVEKLTAEFHSGSCSLKIKSRADYWAGAAQRIDHLIGPRPNFTVEIWVYHTRSGSEPFVLTLYSKGSASSADNDAGPVISVPPNTWTKVSATLTAPIWSGRLEYAFVKIGGVNSGSNNTTDFYVDDLRIYQNTADRYFHRQVLGPGTNPFGTANAQGIYWIDCGGNKLLIERSRIKGTLLLVNPGSGSGIGAGPINWSPAVPGYPALMVRADNSSDADLIISATNRALSETEDGVNFNPSGASHDEFGTDVDTDDIYPSEIRGMIVVEDDLTYQNNATVRGQVIVGDDMVSIGGTLEVDYQPDSLLSPPPGFTDLPSHVYRPGTVRKTVLP